MSIAETSAATLADKRGDGDRSGGPPAQLPAQRLSELLARAREAEVADRLAEADQRLFVVRDQVQSLEAALALRLGELGALARHHAASEARWAATEADLRARLTESERQRKQAKKAKAALRARQAEAAIRIELGRSVEADLRARLAAAEATVAQLLSSTSWRLTGPVRWVVGRVRS